MNAQAVKRMAAYRQARQVRVREALCAMHSAEDRPIPSATLAARTDLRTADVVATLHELEIMPGAGPLFVESGWVWVD